MCRRHVKPSLTPFSISTQQGGNIQVQSTFTSQNPEMQSRLNQKNNQKKSERPVKYSELPWYLENLSESNKKEIQRSPQATCQTLKGEIKRTSLK